MVQKVFSEIDLIFGYHQLKTKDCDITKIAFGIWYYHYEFTIMSFGITNAPTMFYGLNEYRFSSVFRPIHYNFRLRHILRRQAPT